ncbi:beta-N-acetylhexosaminidase [Albimonas sp. CAU 1670]|uniref:beta-N-acetylhexosaminidase n=1 Tax=Albimonas sp. CAU 1670 TaxID=3032599 RepID=UPI0023DA9E80|nr:beta-N-acetylhexosaminidase [Albimonas sp. CAU 1670]MDF2232824.1 beta-N-acetylhexosaminidase [Albimonas sp. CAU 1670]
MMGAPRAIILGCAGPRLSAGEAAFFRDADPWGFILFARNVQDPEQLRALTAELRAAVGRDAPILVDQEGGRVARLKAPHWREWPWMERMVEGLPEAEADAALALQYRVIAHELHAVGLDVNCMPIADVRFDQTDGIISTRALGRSAATVSRRGRVIADAMARGGVLPVLKHLPGHGRATADSHLALPVVDAPLEELRAHDFAAFQPLSDLAMGMTAHIVYTAIDPDAPATQSPAGIRTIREELEFDGLLMTDDLSMNALSGSMAERAELSIAAGCDLILHCNGDMAEMEGALSATPRLEGRALARADAALAARRAPEPFDPAEADARFAQILRALNGEAADA